jgi:very-short-patch-repair endonuclease
MPQGVKPNHPLVRPSREERPNTRPYLQAFRTKLRKRLTPSEAALWRMLQGSKIDGRKFRRQHSLGNYILDFYCPAERLAIELDGASHASEQAGARDCEKRSFVEYHGIRVIRFENHWVFDEADFVLWRIRENFGWWKEKD